MYFKKACIKQIAGFETEEGRDNEKDTYEKNVKKIRHGNVNMHDTTRHTALAPFPPNG